MFFFYDEALFHHRKRCYNYQIDALCLLDGAKGGSLREGRHGNAVGAREIQSEQLFCMESE